LPGILGVFVISVFMKPVKTIFLLSLFCIRSIRCMPNRQWLVKWIYGDLSGHHPY
jgi:hypothetical protein